MPDFIKIDGVDDSSGASDATIDDRGSKYLDTLMGVDNASEASDVSAESGDAGKEQKDGAEQGEPAQSSDSSAKDSNAQSKSEQKGKANEKPVDGSNNGDLKLPDGSTVKAGAERRHYELRRNAEQQLSMRSNELQQSNQARERLQNELNTLKSTVQSIQGADPAHVSTGVKLVRDLQRDPATTLRTLLTEAVAAGYTIEGIAQGIDVQSIRSAITSQVQPLLDQRQQQEQAQQTDQQIEQEVNGFYTQFPDARVHDDVIAAVISKNPQMKLSDAYFQLKNAATERGLDWTQPLGPQITASEQQQPQQQQKPMPNGRGPTGNTQVASADRNVVAHESTSTGDIVKEAMREAGLKI